MSEPYSAEKDVPRTCCPTLGGQAHAVECEARWRDGKNFSLDTPHDPFARECVIVGLPASELHDRPCPACREMSTLVDLDPDFGSAADGRPNLGGAR